MYSFLHFIFYCRYFRGQLETAKKAKPKKNSLEVIIHIYEKKLNLKNLKKTHTNTYKEYNEYICTFDLKAIIFLNEVFKITH